jgi:hypothetical protein
MSRALSAGFVQVAGKARAAAPKRPIQAKPRIGGAIDPLEREADRAADAVIPDCFSGTARARRWSEFSPQRTAVRNGAVDDLATGTGHTRKPSGISEIA